MSTGRANPKRRIAPIEFNHNLGSLGLSKVPDVCIHCVGLTGKRSLAKLRGYARCKRWLYTSQNQDIRAFPEYPQFTCAIRLEARTCITWVRTHKEKGQK